ncbi:PAS domain S-box protein [Litchfieldia alkalitelluris]|uniref:PAS domain S-box protein n=1 Tax=Litchfieldia alkalitelluris TaxID=304268 RepID=UPI000997F327|nr:PAS domain S-box protein [Litchfieldia alkalitelluris]
MVLNSKNGLSLSKSINNTPVNLVASLSLSGKILYLSSSCFDLIGYKKEELIGVSFRDITHHDDIFLVESSLFDQKQENTCLVFRLSTKQTGYIWVQAKVEFIISQVDQKCEEVFVTMSQITNDQTLEYKYDKQIMSFHKNWPSLIEKAPVSIILTIAGTIQYINQEAKDLLGLEKDTKVIGKSLLMFIDKEFHSVVTKGLYLLSKGHRIGTSQQKWLKENGEMIDVELRAVPITENGKQIELFVVQNITSKKKFQRVLQQSRERYEKIVHNSIDAIAVIYNDTWAFINDSGVKMFGAENYTEILGKNIYSFLHKKYHKEMKDLISLVIHENREHTITKQSWYTIKGKHFYTEFICIPTTFIGKPAVQVIIRDISDRKHAEDLMIKSEKLSIAGQLAAGIAHEIRNPLTSIKGFLQLIQTHSKGNETYYQIVFSELNRVEAILSELLVLAKPTEDFFIEVDVRDIIRDVITLLEAQAALQNIQIKLSIPNDVAMITCDENQIKQVFINLIKNSIDSMKDGGIISIAISVCEEYVQLSFKDEGCGIPDSIIDRIGEPFYTTKEKGTGLGLMVSYKIIENHNGLICVESKVNVGTTFNITLPKSQPKKS